MTALKLYLDDCVYSKRLQQMLQEKGHQVISPLDAGLMGSIDAVHFAYACQNQLIIVTKDAADFTELHEQNNQHQGILVVREEHDYTKNMSYVDIVRAIENLISAQVPLQGQFYVLNHWQW